MRKLWCWVVGHRWHMTAMNRRKHVNLMHLFTLAGCAGTCTRCGEIWDDVTGGGFFDDVIEGVVPVAKLPTARMVKS